MESVLKNILKVMPMSVIASVAASLMIQKGNDYCNKDANNTGSDDAKGKLLISAAPAVVALASDNEFSLQKGLRALRDAIDNYLAQSAKA